MSAPARPQTKQVDADQVTLSHWMTWVPRLAILWAAAYACVRLWFATGHAPEWKLPGGDLLIADPVSVAGCVASAAAVLALRWRTSSRLLIGVLWSLAAGWVAVSAFALLDLVGGLLPGLGIPFDLPGILSRSAALVGAGLLGASALARQRQLDPSCLSCSGRPSRVDKTPRWAMLGGWMAVAGCLIRLAAQLAVGFGSGPNDPGPSRVLFDIGFVLAGVLLPMLLVYPVGRRFPRWMLLFPGAGLGIGITAYFGVGLIQMITASLRGEPIFGDIALPDTFFWVAVPAYLIWGLGLAAATYAYHLRTRRPCKGCGR